MNGPDQIVLFGGAGFLGRSLAQALTERNHPVVIVDSCEPGTNFSRARSLATGARCLWLSAAEAFEHAATLAITPHTAVVDCMGWSAHIAGLGDPLRDMELNLGSHIALGRFLLTNRPGLVISIGSRHQYGATCAPLIDEDTPQIPVDIQSIHKVAAESHWRLLQLQLGCPVLSLRVGNVFGDHQPLGKGEIGLLGSLFKDALYKPYVSLAGGSSYRSIVYAEDLGCVVHLLLCLALSGFQVYNIAGTHVQVRCLAQTIANLANKPLTIQPLPSHIAALQISDAEVSQHRVLQLLGSNWLTPLDRALSRTLSMLKRLYPSIA